MDLNLKQLSKKLVTLLALSTAHRVQTLAAIKLTDIHFAADHITILVSDLLKTSVTVKSKTILRLPYFNNLSICPATTLTTYIDKTKVLRGDTTYLILTSTKPFKKASTQTISRWIKEVLNESCIDIHIYSSHSTRHAATSKAKMAGISIETIKKAAGWTEKSAVFAKHYDLPIVNEASHVSFANSVLQ